MLLEMSVQLCSIGALGCKYICHIFYHQCWVRVYFCFLLDIKEMYMIRIHTPYIYKNMVFELVEDHINCVYACTL